MATDKILLCGFADEADPMIDGQIKALSENGISLLEIRGVDGKNIADISCNEAIAVKEKLDAANISVWSLGSPIGKININDDFDKEIERLRHVLDIGRILGAKCIRLFSFYGTDGKEEYFAEVCRRLQKYVEVCSEYGIVPCHENEKGIYGDTAEKCLSIHKAVSGLKSVFDTANFVQCGQNTLEAWDMLEEYVYYGHIKDADEEGNIVPPGQGIGNIPVYLPKFVDKGCRVLTLEPHLAEFVGLAGLEEEDAKSNVGKMEFENNRAAFDYAVNSLKKIVEDVLC
jgi:sugar phosphate isomerase/epimerase